MHDADVPSAARYTKEERQARQELAACYRLADHFGFSDVIWNHITARVPGGDRFLINRFGLRFDEVTASNLVTLPPAGEVTDRGTAESAEDINATGFIIHGAVFAARPEVNCVMHSHVAAGLAVSVLEEQITPMILDTLPLYGRIAYHDFEGLSVDPDEMQRLACDLGSANAMVLRNHGLLTCGASVGEAFMTMYYLERACRVHLDVAATGRSTRLPTDAQCREAAVQQDRFPYGLYEWPALLRLADARFPDYRK